jgi:kynurenine formamidase
MAQAIPVSADEFDELFQRCSNWGRWGDADQRGTLNTITQEKIREAASLVREGTTVSCSLPLGTQPGPANPSPVTHLMISAGDLENASGSQDYFAISTHGPANTHLDAFCHIFYKDQMYNGQPKSKVTSRGALAGSIDIMRQGVVSRGVLLDVPWAKGVEWLEPGEAILTEDLEACAEKARVRIGPGDIVLVRTGRHTRVRAGQPPVAPMPGPIPMLPVAGLHTSVGPWLREKDIALLGGDNFSDVLPSATPFLFPVHILTLVAMGTHLLDNGDFDALGKACQERERWEFQLFFGPLILERGTGSPVNPIAVF